MCGAVTVVQDCGQKPHDTQAHSSVAVYQFIDVILRRKCYMYRLFSCTISSNATGKIGVRNMSLLPEQFPSGSQIVAWLLKYD
jgi:hypothetical protein